MIEDDDGFFSEGDALLDIPQVSLPEFVVVVVEELPKVETTSSHQGIYFVIKLSRLLRLLH